MTKRVEYVIRGIGANGEERDFASFHTKEAAKLYAKGFNYVREWIIKRTITEEVVE